MKFLNLFSLLYLIQDGGQGCFQLLGFVFVSITLVLLLKFICENFIITLIVYLVVITLLVGINFLKDYLKYKDETLEQRAERLKTKEMIKEWQKRYY